MQTTDFDFIASFTYKESASSSYAIPRISSSEGNSKCCTSLNGIHKPITSTVFKFILFAIIYLSHYHTYLATAAYVMMTRLCNSVPELDFKRVPDKQKKFRTFHPIFINIGTYLVHERSLVRLNHKPKTV